MADVLLLTLIKIEMIFSPSVAVIFQFKGGR